MKLFREVVPLQIRRKLCDVNLCLCKTPAKELFGYKAGSQILQIYKILNIFIYFGYFFKFMYSCRQMISTFMQIDTEEANTWCSKKQQAVSRLCNICAVLYLFCTSFTCPKVRCMYTF